MTFDLQDFLTLAVSPGQTHLKCGVNNCDNGALNDKLSRTHLSCDLKVYSFFDSLLFLTSPPCSCLLLLHLCRRAGAVHYSGFRVVIGHTLMTNSFSSDFCRISILCRAAAHLTKQAPHSCFLSLPWQLESQPRMGHQAFYQNTMVCIILFVCMAAQSS